jgi:hypothetical protein
MEGLRFASTALLFSCGFLTPGTIAQCHDASFGAVGPGSSPSVGSAPTLPGQGGEDDRIVDLTLVLRKSGAVRNAKVLRGPMVLREPAIRAAKHRNYKDALHGWPFSNEIMVEVTFPKDTNGTPDIRQAMPGGVPGCVYATRVRIRPEVMQTYLLERVDPVYPAGIEVLGVLILRLHIEEDGSVSSVEKVSGHDALAPAAIDAVQKWKYRPCGLNGAVIAVETTVELKPPNSALLPDR